MGENDLKKHNGVTTPWMIDLSNEAFDRWAGYITTIQLTTDPDEGDSLYLDFRDLNGNQYCTHIFSDEYVLVYTSQMIDMEEDREYLCTIKFSDLLSYLDSLPKTALGVFNRKAIPFNQLPENVAGRIRDN
jgi:hypothetical protein